jgi:hypothetical protein
MPKGLGLLIGIGKPKAGMAEKSAMPDEGTEPDMDKEAGLSAAQDLIDAVNASDRRAVLAASKALYEHCSATSYEDEEG